MAEDNIIPPHLLGKERDHFDWDKHKQDLVVKECISVIMNADEQYLYRKSYLADLLHKHFGVE